MTHPARYELYVVRCSRTSDKSFPSDQKTWILGTLCLVPLITTKISLTP